MTFFTNPLNLVTLFPLVGALLLLFFKQEQKKAIRWTALIVSLITFALSIWVLYQFDASNPDLQMVISLPWIEIAGWQISYQLGIDG
jgi:NADH-quinone oxidoreductase subunit M